jgi:hypothetical protein
MDTRMKEGKSVGRGAYSVIVAGLALSLMWSSSARALNQEPQQDQTQQQNQPQEQAPAQDQQQTAQPDRPASPPAAKPKPKYASQDANKPPYANDRQGPSPYSAPAPDAENGDEDQDQQPPDDRQAPPSYRGRATRPSQREYSNAQPARPTAPLPSTLTIPAGTVLAVRMNDFVSSDKNQVGNRITATLEWPIVVNGWVVARRGQTLTGQVTAAVKAGRVKGTSQLGLELTDLPFVDGNSAPILTEIWKGSGGTTHGADAAAIGGTTALGAAIGAAADWGTGAAIGAGAGAAAGIAAVLLTRGRPTEILPETPLTFRLVDPVTVDTTKSAQSFAPVTQRDYDGGGRGYRGGRPYAAYGGPYGYGAPYPYPGPYAYPGPYPYAAYPYPYYYSPSVVFYGGGWGYHGRRW